MTTDVQLAFDRSVRKVDVDGRLHVEVSNISKANVCPYIGKEIPGWASLGLASDQIYMLLRDPGEIAKAASTFNNIPLLIKHVPVTADKPEKQLVVGSTGTDAEFVAPYLRNSLVVWDSVAIAGINTKEQCELSSAYRYTALMTPGVYEGVAYDGVMTNIIGNHVALVEVGRAGSDVVVGDSNPFITEKSTMKQQRIAKITAALIASVTPMLAQDAKLDPKEVEKHVTLALDADPDDKEKKEKVAEDEDEDDEEEKKKKAKVAEDEKDDEKDKKEAKAAMDAAIQSAVTAAEQATIKRMNAIRQAEKEVQPIIGEVVAQDSAEAIYKLALDHAKVDVAGVHPSAYGAMVRMLPKPGDTPKPRIAMDAASNDDFAKRFPTAGKLIRS